MTAPILLGEGTVRTVIPQHAGEQISAWYTVEEWENDERLRLAYR